MRGLLDDLLQSNNKKYDEVVRIEDQIVAQEKQPHAGLQHNNVSSFSSTTSQFPKKSRISAIATYNPFSKDELEQRESELKDQQLLIEEEMAREEHVQHSLSHKENALQRDNVLYSFETLPLTPDRL